MATREPVQFQSQSQSQSPSPSPSPPQNSTAKTTARNNNQINDTGELIKRVKKNRQRSSSFVVGCPDHSRQDCSPVRGEFRLCSSSLSAEFTDVASIAAAEEQYLEQGCESFSVQSFLLPSTSQKASMTHEEKEKNKTGLKSQRNGCTVPWRWSRMRKGIRRRKVISLMGRRSINGNNQMTISKSNCSHDQIFSEEHSREEIDRVSQDICDSGFHSAYLSGQNSQQNDRDQRSHSKDERHSSTSISHKYQPKLFQDIAGHEIIIKAISNAVQKEQVAHLYLFHGPSGTGKTSTARIFAMALNCKSTSHTKPCWSCRGCSRSHYIMELCSGTRITGFERIRTLLQSTSFTQAIPGFKVLIIEECHSLTAEAWDELLGIVEGGCGSAVVFVLITVDANMVPRTISSRCQKFFFPKLKDIDITLKLARIVAREDIGIGRAALKLIIAKAEGSLREAENILDQLALLGPRLTSSMVQQLVGLVPHDKLIDLLATAISGDTLKTIRFTRELIATGVEPQALVSQLTSLITDILSGAAVAVPDSSSLAGPSNHKRFLRSGSQLTNTQSERLFHAFKILVEAEKQPKSSIDQTTWIFSALVQIASEDVSNRISTGIVLPRDITLSTGDKPNAQSVDIHRRSRKNHQSISQTSEQLDMDRTDLSTIIKSINKTKRCRGKSIENEPNLACMSDMEELWLNLLERIQSRHVKEFLCCQVKLASLTVSSANAIVHLMFKRPEDKLAAQMSEESLTRSLENAIGCPVTVNMSLEPVDLTIIQENTVSTTKSQLQVDCSHSRQQQRTVFLPESIYSTNTGAVTHCNTHRRSSQGRDRCPSGEKEATTAQPQQILPFPRLLKQANQLDASEDPKPNSLTREWAPIHTAHIRRTNKPKHRWLSLSSIQQSDASVEPYSQDILFENANTEKESRARRNQKHQKGFSKANEDHHPLDSTTSKYSSWNCTDILCQRKAKVRNHAA